MKTKFLIVDGMDGCGKSTLIAHLLTDHSGTKELKFKKTLPSGDLLRISEEKDFELLFTVFHHLDKNFTYIIDRFMVSNLVYDKILRGLDTSTSSKYYELFKSEFNVMEVFLTRPPISSNFEDDRISASTEQFNQGIIEYTKFGTNYDILTRDELGRPNGVTHESSLVHKLCSDFIKFF